MSVIACFSVYGQGEWGTMQERNEWPFNKKKKSFNGFHGYYMVSGEMLFLDGDYFKKILGQINAPAVELQPYGYLSWMSYMKDRLFTSMGYSYADATQKNDTLRSRLNQSNYAFNIGYNILATESVVISTYVGLRLFRFRHITGRNRRSVDLVDYLSDSNYDLRVSQFSGTCGINTTFNYNDKLSFGFYFSYVENLHHCPIIKVPRNRIRSSVGSPVKNLVIGMGMGVGFNRFR
jgi:hypothetical protein